MIAWPVSGVLAIGNLKAIGPGNLVFDSLIVCVAFDIVAKF